MEKNKQFLHLKQTKTFELLEQSNPTSYGSLAETINDFFVSVSAHLSTFDFPVLDGMQQDFSDKYNYHRSHRDRASLVTSQSPQSFRPWRTPELVTTRFGSVAESTFSRDFQCLVARGLPTIDLEIRGSIYIVPVPKVHPPISIHNDLRPISLLPTIARVFESVVGKLFLPFIEPHLHCSQFGCRKSRSTTHTLIAILHTWMTALDSHGSVRTVFVDFRSKDLVDHNILFAKLTKYNIPNFLLLWFASYLTNRDSVSGSIVQCPVSTSLTEQCPRVHSWVH